MQETLDFQRQPSPAPQPHPLAYANGGLWIGSWETDRLYLVDPKTRDVSVDIAAPGKPFGMTAAGNELRVVISHGEDDDDRYLYRVTAAGGFDLDSKMPCPDLTGSYLAFDGSTLYLGQMTLRRILALHADGSVRREIPLPTRCAGIAFGPDGRLYMISGDSELEQLKFGTLDISRAEPVFSEIAALPDEARSLAHDGSRWWSCLRDLNELASFTCASYPSA